MVKLGAPSACMFAEDPRGCSYHRWRNRSAGWVAVPYIWLNFHGSMRSEWFGCMETLMKEPDALAVNLAITISVAMIALLTLTGVQVCFWVAPCRAHFLEQLLCMHPHERRPG